VIARRIIQLQNREEDMGAMYLRQVLWSLHEKVGDGTTTAAVMFQTIYNEGIRYVVAGGNAMQFRQYLEEASKAILDELESQVIHLQGKEQFAKLAETICHDPPLAKMLGEIFDTVGEYGRLDIHPGRSRELEREYVEGMFWDTGVLSREMIPDQVVGNVQMENAAILCTDLEIKEPEDVFSFLERLIHADCKGLLLVAAGFSDRALSVLLANREKIQVVAVKAPAIDVVTRSEALEDLALLTGGRAFFQAAGETLNSVRLADLGYARRVWARLDNFGMSGGKGDPRRLRQHIAQLRNALPNLTESNQRRRLQERIGKLMGGVAVLWVGANTPLAVEARKTLAERTIEAMRGAIKDGVLPGGGIALFSCQQILRKKMNAAKDMNERVAYRILSKAVEIPIRTLLENAGYEPDRVLRQIALSGPGSGFDVVGRQIVNMADAGIYDSAAVLKGAVFSAVHGAALALTIDVLVHMQDPITSYHRT
jgi:chaperonin GroEL